LVPIATTMLAVSIVRRRRENVVVTTLGGLPPTQSEQRALVDGLEGQMRSLRQPHLSCYAVARCLPNLTSEAHRSASPATPTCAYLCLVAILK
jgi:hypothetical protein